MDQKEFTQKEFIELNYESIIESLDNNLKDSDKLLEVLKSNEAIFTPSTALELSEIFIENLKLGRFIETAKEEGTEINVPANALEELFSKSVEYHSRFNKLIEVESKNKGNLALFIRCALGDEYSQRNLLGLINSTERMIDLNFNNRFEGVVINGR